MPENDNDEVKNPPPVDPEPASTAGPQEVDDIWFEMETIRGSAPPPEGVVRLAESHSDDE